MNSDVAAELVEQVTQAYTGRDAVRIAAGGSKAFYGNAVDGQALDVSGHAGIIDYRASELVITARSGTQLSDMETALSEQNQQLAFEPPRHSTASTIGGVIACGLSGPARPFFGAARDFVLGAKIVNGKGELLQFGGQVMKNVAGYDLSRLMVGAQGSLGVILEVSLKVLPKAEAETTLAFEVDAAAGHRMLRGWLADGHPVTASCYYRGLLSVRLSSTENCIAAASKKIGGEAIEDDLWHALRDQTHPCFEQPNMWRLSLPPAAPISGDDDDALIEWGGALRWQTSTTDLFDHARQLGGHATRYDVGAKPSDDIFQPLQPAMLSMHKRIKNALDPNRILNPGRLYRAL